MSRKKSIMSKISGQVNPSHKDMNDYTGEEVKSSVLEFYKIVANTKVYIGICIALYIIGFVVFYYIASHFMTMNLHDLIRTGDISYSKINFLDVMHKSWFIFVIYTIFAAVFAVKYYVQFKMSFGDLKDRTEREFEDDSRWSEKEEIDAAYKKIKLRDEPFPGNGGPPVAADETGEYLYIDDTPTNCLVIGTSRSGKDQLHVEPTMEIGSRAEIKPSFIVTDIKMETAPKAMKMLQDRGYDTHLLNLIDPEYSMFYNPLTPIIEETKAGNFDQATEMRKSFCENAIPTQPGDKEKFFVDQARNVLSAAIYADIDDNLKADKDLNRRLKREYDRRYMELKKAAIDDLSEEEARLYRIKESAQQIMHNNPEMEMVGIRYSLLEDRLPQSDKEYIESLTEEELEDYLNKRIPTIHFQEPAPFIPTTENEKKIHLNSIVKMVTALYGIRDNEYKGTALDRYFLTRPLNDEARLLYSGVSGSSDSAKGDIMSTFSQLTNIFITDNIGRMMSKNSLNFLDVGFGKKPVAVFIALPDANKANWFIATVFINQLYTTLSKYATAMPGGQTIRDVVFLLNEFGNLPALDNLESMVSVALGRRLRFHFIVQSFAQMTEKYGDGIKQIVMDNIGLLKYILTTNDTTLEEVSKIIGNHHVSRFNRSGRILSVSKEQTEMVELVPLISPNKLGKLLKGENIVIRPLHREDKDGNPQFANPIKNLGKDKMKLSYQYLSDLMPQKQLLYRSSNLDTILLNNPDIKGMKDIENMKIVDWEINETKKIDLKQLSRRVDLWYKLCQLRNTTVADFVEASDENRIVMDKVFDLSRASESLREKIKDGEDEDYAYTLGKYIDYAYSLLEYPRWRSAGYDILDLLLPCEYNNYFNDSSEFIDFDELEPMQGE